jgi:bacterioferritin-associated ferredoxin
MRLHGLTTFEELKSVATFGENCRLCEPYIKKMIKTRKTSFKVFTEKIPETGNSQ